MFCFLQQFVILTLLLASALGSTGFSTFSYGVSDPNTGDFKDQYEKREGDNVVGKYSLIDADGSKRIVLYSANDATGFQAIVQKERGGVPSLNGAFGGDSLTGGVLAAGSFGKNGIDERADSVHNHAAFTTATALSHGNLHTSSHNGLPFLEGPENLPGPQGHFVYGYGAPLLSGTTSNIAGHSRRPLPAVSHYSHTIFHDVQSHGGPYAGASENSNLYGRYRNQAHLEQVAAHRHGASDDINHFGTPVYAQGYETSADAHHYRAPSHVHHYGTPDNAHRFGVPVENHRYTTSSEANHQGISDDVRNRGTPSDVHRPGASADAHLYRAPADAHRHEAPTNSHLYGAPADSHQHEVPIGADRYGVSTDVSNHRALTNGHRYGELADAHRNEAPADAHHYRAPLNTHRYGAPDYGGLILPQHPHPFVSISSQQSLTSHPVHGLLSLPDNQRATIPHNYGDLVSPLGQSVFSSQPLANGVLSPFFAQRTLPAPGTIGPIVPYGGQPLTVPYPYPLAPGRLLLPLIHGIPSSPANSALPAPLPQGEIDSSLKHNNIKLPLDKNASNQRGSQTPFFNGPLGHGALPQSDVAGSPASKAVNSQERSEPSSVHATH